MKMTGWKAATWFYPSFNMTVWRPDNRLAPQTVRHYLTRIEDDRLEGCHVDQSQPCRIVYGIVKP